MTSAVDAAVVYPESDGEPMADNDRQREIMNQLKYGLERQFLGQEVYVTSDLFWYPVQGQPGIRTAPDVMAVFGRPPGQRRSYLQWQEDGKAPDVVVEVLSLGNTAREMLDKLTFYDRYSVAEYLVFDPATGALDVWLRAGAQLVHQQPALPWRSQRLEVAIDVEPSGDEFVLAVTGRDGRRFPSMAELAAERDHLAAERDRIAAERDHLRRRLREVGLDP